MYGQSPAAPMYAISRYENGICLNALEYVLDDNNDVLLFDTPQAAIAHLQQHGVESTNQDDLADDYGIYITLEG